MFLYDTYNAMRFQTLHDINKLAADFMVVKANYLINKASYEKST